MYLFKMKIPPKNSLFRSRNYQDTQMMLKCSLRELNLNFKTMAILFSKTTT